MQGGGDPAVPEYFMRFTFSQPVACSGLAVLRQDGAGPSTRTSQACSPARNNFSLSCLKLRACSVSFSRVNCVVFFFFFNKSLCLLQEVLGNIDKKTDTHVLIQLKLFAIYPPQFITVK